MAPFLPKIMRLIKKGFFQKRVFHILLITFIGLLAYSNTFHAPFEWDEDVFLLENPIIKHLDYFLEPLKAKGLPFYDGLISRYMGYLTFAINYRLHGFNVAGYHIVNISIHLINTVLVYFLILFTFRTPYMRDSNSGSNAKALALAVSLLFVLHPVQTEAVTYVFQRFALLAAMFYLLSLVAYIKARLALTTELTEKSFDIKEPKKFFWSARSFSLSSLWLVLSFISAVLAMVTKENAFTLPFVILLYEFCFFPSPRTHNLSPITRFYYLAPLLLTLCIIPLEVVDMNRPFHQVVSQIATADVGFAKMPRWLYLFTQFRVIVTYLRLLVFPVNQTLVYDYPIYRSFFAPPVLLSFLFLALILGVGIYLVYKTRQPDVVSLPVTHHPLPITRSPEGRVIGFGILWFFVTLSVESSIIPLSTIIDEYRLYLPSVGFFIALCMAMSLLAGKIRLERERRMFIQLVILVFAVLLGTTYVRNSVWSDEVAFWKDVIEKSPNYGNAYNNLGHAWLSINRPDKAMEVLNRAIALSPDLALAWHNRGRAFAQKKDYDRAIKDFNKSETIRENFMSYLEIGKVYFEKGEFSLAIENFLKALAMNPHSEASLYCLALSYERVGKYNEAMRLFDEVLHDDPFNSDAYCNRGVLYLSYKEYAKAIADFSAAVRINPQHLISRYYCAVAHHYLGQYDAAISEYGRAIALNDKNPVFYDGRGLSFYYKRDFSNAIKDFTRAIELNPPYPMTYSSRGLAESEIKEFDLALADYNKALSLDPKLGAVYTNRGNLYLAEGKKTEAANDFRRGCALKDDSACSTLRKF